VTLGFCCIVNANAVLEHDTAIGPSCFIAAGAMVGANVRIGEGSFLGLNCTLREHISVGEFASSAWALTSSVTCRLQRLFSVIRRPNEDDCGT